MKHLPIIKCVAYRATLLCIFLITMQTAIAQETTLHYTVKKGDKNIGTFTVVEQSSSVAKTIKLVSHIKTSFIVAVSVDAEEESHFQNGVLSKSSVYRKVNGDEKLNKKHSYCGNGYVVYNNRQKDSVCCIKIGYNLMCLYNAEPVNISKVYSDNFQQFLSLKALGSNKYRIDMPDGNFNIYHYSNGKCITIEMHHSMYTITMQLT